MNLTYRKAAFDDIDILTKTRTQVLRAANELEEDADMSAVEKETYDYYLTALKTAAIRHFLFLTGEFLSERAVSAFIV